MSRTDTQRVAMFAIACLFAMAVIVGVVTYAPILVERGGYAQWLSFPLMFGGICLAGNFLMWAAKKAVGA